MSTPVPSKCNSVDLNLTPNYSSRSASRQTQRFRTSPDMALPFKFTAQSNEGTDGQTVNMPVGGSSCTLFLKRY